MSSYTRTTRECDFSQIHPQLSQAIREYFQTHQLGDPDTEIRLCCETITEKHNPGKLVSLLEADPDSIVHLVLLLTTDWFIWARHGSQTGALVNGTRLKGLQVKTFVTKRTDNMQLEILGRIGGAKDFVRGRLELGPEREAQKFCEEVVRSVQSLTPPVKKSRLRWFGM
jgi:hypothetical protein